jgi:hypothetical protein
VVILVILVQKVPRGKVIKVYSVISFDSNISFISYLRNPLGKNE